MTSVRYVSMTLFLAAAAGSLLPSAGVAQTPSTFTVIASKLEAPRGLRFGPDGDLYIGELGGGDDKGVASVYRALRQTA